ncbi:MAG: NUDIX domain-containing protein [bacterium]|nr:NUDIX domain-containing protein [bacterium]
MYRKGVSALIVNSNNEFLLVNLVSFEEKYFAIPGGGIEDGETMEDAAYREIHEELGIERISLDYAGKAELPLTVMFVLPKMTRDGKEYAGSERYFFGFSFVGKDEEIKLQAKEVRSYKWVQFTELYKHLLFDNQLEETRGKILEIFPFFEQTK